MTRLFIIYARKDRTVRNKLVNHLRPLVQSGEVSIWSDREIKPGDVWDDEVRQRLADSEIILMLVSDGFFASDYINKVELQLALEQHREKKVMLVPIIARHCAWQDFPALSDLQALPDDGRPIISGKWDSPDEPYLKVVAGVRRLLRAPDEKPIIMPPPTTSAFKRFIGITTGLLLLLAVAIGAQKYWKITEAPSGAFFQTTAWTPFTEKYDPLRKTPVDTGTTAGPDPGPYPANPPQKPSKLSSRSQKDIAGITNQRNNIERVEVIIKHPDDVNYPTVTLTPPETKKIEGLIITRVWVQPDQTYTVKLCRDGTCWQATIHGSEKIIDAGKFQKLK